MKNFPFPIEELKNWFLFERRELPWRQSTDPYAVWISEIMLQQTQVSVVKEYYSRWMARFPTVGALAEAPFEKVIKLWEGLGYYNRVRHLHDAARLVHKKYDGKLPSSKEELSQIKGLGPYTIGAILSFAFHQKAAAVDGNTIRVLARYFGIGEDVKKSGTIKKIWAVAEEILPNQEPWLIVEALIELGAMVCKRDPLCTACPLRKQCSAKVQGLQSVLPKKGKKVEITILLREVHVIFCGDELLVKKGKAGEIMADLYEFPYLEKTQEGKFPFNFPAEKIKDLASVVHSFTRYRAELYPTLWKTSEKRSVPGCQWIAWKEVEKLPFSSGHKKILHIIKRDFHAYFTH